MHQCPLEVSGAALLELAPLRDERGWFARTWCKETFDGWGLQTPIAQINQSWSEHRGTLRGMHWMASPKREAKTLSVLRGRIWDVVADIRRGSPTYGRWCGVELRAGDDRAVHVPAGCAHGFLTLEPDTLIQYFITEAYDPPYYRGMRWNDPRFAIAWPEPPAILHPRDRSYADFADEDATDAWSPEPLAHRTP